MPVTSCDICLGSDLRPHRAAKACGRRLVACVHCGLVAAVDADRPPGPSAARDARFDAPRAAAIAGILGSGRILAIGPPEGLVPDHLDPRRYRIAALQTDPGSAAGFRPERLDAESFDLAVIFGALGRAPSPRALLMETVRLLRGGGQVLIETPSLSTFTARLMGARWAPFADPATRHIFDQRSLERLVSTCGLVPIATRTALPIGWPRPGTVICTARKTSETIKSPALPGIASVAGMSKATPQGA